MNALLCKQNAIKKLGIFVSLFSIGSSMLTLVHKQADRRAGTWAGLPNTANGIIILLLWFKNAGDDVIYLPNAKYPVRAVRVGRV